MFERLFGSDARSTLIDAAFRDIASMLEQSEKMLELALASMLDNEPLEVDLDSMDDSVDEGERMVRRSVLEHLSINPTSHLVPSLVLVSMVQDAERIGDFARGIGELVPLAESPREGEFRDELREMADGLKPLFRLCSDGFRDDNSSKSRQVMVAASALKARHMDYTVRLAASDLSADMAVVYSGSARILRRIAAHLSNIASSVVQPFDQIRHGDEEV